MGAPQTRGLIVLASFVALALAAGVALRKVLARPATARASQVATKATTAGAGGEMVLRVPHLPGSITLDGDTDDPGWLRFPGPARTGAFVFKNGMAARPYSNARLVWGGEYLYLSLYASDQDIESHTDKPDEPIPPEDDAFRVIFSQGDVEYALEITPRGLITDSMRKGDAAWDVSWSSGAHASREVDGSINVRHGKDEEWAIELAVPFVSLGMRGEPGENIGMSLHRCDTAASGARACMGWGEGPGDRGRGRIVLE